MNMLMTTDALKQHLPEDVTVCYVLEPSDLWRARGWLQAFYEKAVRRGFAFQDIVYDTHVDAVRNKLIEVGNDKPVVCVVERCMYDQLLFWTVRCELAGPEFEPIEDDAYAGLWRKWKDLLIPRVRAIFYLEVSSLEELQRRIKSRGRAEEQNGISPEYLEALWDKHNEWMTEPLTSFPNGDSVPCVHINMDAPLTDIFNDIAVTMAAKIKLVIAK
jgi:deoxyadenosine/deoxycytidine kinase